MKIYSKYVSGRKDSDTLIIEKMKTSPQFNELVNVTKNLAKILYSLIR